MMNTMPYQLEPQHGLGERILVCDGATGTMLHAAGNTLDQALPALNLAAPERVRTIHDSYIEAGVDIVQTNTFGANQLRLAQYGFDDQVEAINHAGVRLARSAATNIARPILVAGSVSPAVTVQQRRHVGQQQRRAALREQLTTLVEAGVDLVLLETFGYLDELIEAVELAAQVAETPLIAQATFADDTYTLDGHTPQQVATTLNDLPIRAMGLNCTLGPQQSLTVLRELRTYSTLPLTVQPNAGLPRRLTPTWFEYDTSPDYFARYTRRYLDAGASIVGGCCGTTPAHLTAAVHAAETHRRAQQGNASSAPGRDRANEADTGTDSPPSKVAFAGPQHAIAVELTPPTSGELDDTVVLARQLARRSVDLLAIAPASHNRAQLSPVNFAVYLHQHLNVPTIVTVRTWDRTIMALQADLLGAHALGLRRIICETGTPPLVGDYPHVDGIWDVDSVGLIELLTGLNQGLDYNGLSLPGRTHFEIGARITPGSHELDRAAARAQAKITAGAQFLVTHPVYEATGLQHILARIDQRVPVYATIHPLGSYDEAEYLAHEVPDTTIPPATLAALEHAGKQAPEAGLGLATQLATELKPITTGTVIAASPNQLLTTSAHFTDPTTSAGSDRQ